MGGEGGLRQAKNTLIKGELGDYSASAVKSSGWRDEREGPTER